MISTVIEYFNSITVLPQELVGDIVKYSTIREYKKEAFILKAGKISNYTSWILRGLTRSYYEREGEEITTKFLWEGAPVTSVYSYYNRRPGNENILALEDTVMACQPLCHRGSITLCD